MSLFPSTTDRLFARFCRTGDPVALGKVFERTAAELLRVACFLVGHRADAEDLVQRTFLAAIESRASFQQGARALPWLLGILANHGRQLQRERRRQNPPAAERNADPVAEAAERELTERLAGLRRELGAPYADVVQLHLEQGLNAKEIAERLQRPAGTVRTQLVRALELLRQRLPDGFVAGGAFAFLGRPPTAAAPALAAMRDTIVRVATRACPTATAVPLVVLGSLFVTKKLVAIASLLLCLSMLGAWLAWPEAATTPSAPLAAAPGVAPAASAPGAGTAPLATPESSRTAANAGVHDAAAAPEPGFATIRVLVKWSAAEPAPGVGVFATNGRAVARRDAVTDQHGLAELPHLAPGTWRVSTTLTQSDVGIGEPPAPVTLAAGEVHTLEVFAARLATAKGRVVDADDHAIAGARIWMSTEGDWSHGHEVATSAADGTFAVPIVGAHDLGARKAGYAPSHVCSTNPLNAADTTIVLRLDHLGGGVHGTVSDERGAPIPWAKILVGEQVRRRIDNTAQPTDRLLLPRGVEVASGRDGAFAVDGLPVGLLDVRAWAPGFAPWSGGIEVVASSTAALAIVLVPGANVRGTVRNAAGAPVAGALVHWNQDHEFAQASAKSADDGSFQLEDLPAGELLLQAEQGGARTEARVALAAGNTAMWNPVLATDLAISGRVQDASGRGRSKVTVTALHARSNEQLAESTTDANGRFELRDVGADNVLLDVAVDFQTLEQVPGVAPGRADVVVTLPDEQMPSAYFTGRVVDERGAAIDATLVPWREGSVRARHYRSRSDTGAFRVGPLRPGHYRLDVDSAKFGRASLGEFDLAANQTREVADFVMRTPGAAEFTVTMFGRPATGGTIYFRQPEGDWNDSCSIDQGKARHDALPQGLVLVTAEHQGLTMSTQVTIAAGAVAQATLDLQPTKRATITLLGVEAMDKAKRPPLTARRADGSFAGLFGAVLVEGPATYFVDLPPGAYSLAVVTDGRKATLAVDLRAGSIAATMTLPPR